MRGGKRVGDGGQLAAPAVSKAPWLRLMGGRGEPARADRLAFVTKRCGAILLAGMAVVAISANGTFTRGAARAADLNNTGTIDNNVARTQNVATNTGTINNNSGGAWTGAVLTNAGAINNNSGGTWTGNANNTAGTLTNAGIWTGDANNAGTVVNSGTWTTTSAGFANSGTLTTIGTLDATNGGLANTGTVNANGGALKRAVPQKTRTLNRNGTGGNNSPVTQHGGAPLAIKR